MLITAMAALLGALAIGETIDPALGGEVGRTLHPHVAQIDHLHGGIYP